MIWPAGPSAPPEAPPWLDEENGELPVLICGACGEEFLSGQSCQCSEPELAVADTDPPLSWDPGDPGWAPTQVAP